MQIGAAVAALLFISASMTVEVFYIRDVVGSGRGRLRAGDRRLDRGNGARRDRHGLADQVLLAVAALAALALQGAGMAASALWPISSWRPPATSIGGIGHGVKNVLLRTLIEQRVPSEAHGCVFADNGARNTAELGALGLGGVLVGVRVEAGADPRGARAGGRGADRDQPARLQAEQGGGVLAQDRVFVMSGGSSSCRARTGTPPGRTSGSRSRSRPVRATGADLAAHVLGQVADPPAGDVEIDVGLVQRHRDRLEGATASRRARHDPHARAPRGRSGRAGSGARGRSAGSAAGLAGAEPLVPAVRE